MREQSWRTFSPSCVKRDSRPDSNRCLVLLGGRRGGPLLGCAAGLAHPRSGFEKRDFPAGEAAIVDEFVADRAAGPSTAEHGFVPIQAQMADFTVPGLNSQQHRLPIPAGFSNAHSGREYSEWVSGNTRSPRVNCRWGIGIRASSVLTFPE